MSTTFTNEELRIIKRTLLYARRDIWQTARVNEQHLTGKDPAFPKDEPLPEELRSGRCVTRAGLDESYGRIELIESTLRMIAEKESEPQPQGQNEHTH